MFSMDDFFACWPSFEEVAQAAKKDVEEYPERQEDWAAIFNPPCNEETFYGS